MYVYFDIWALSPTENQGMRDGIECGMSSK